MRPSRRFRHKFVRLVVKDLRLNAHANRELRPTRVKRLVREMDLDKLGVFVVWRDGRDLWVIDGQHRKLALEEIGFGDWEVDCEIIEGASFADACDLFLGRNDAMLVRPYDKFDKSVKAGYEAATETKRIVEAAGFTISEQAGDGKLVCVVAAVDSYKLDRGESLARALDIIVGSWGHKKDAVEGQIVRGLSIFAHSYNGEVDQNALIGKLRKVKAPNMIASARSLIDTGESGSVARNVARVARGIYNKGRRSGQLPPL